MRSQIYPAAQWLADGDHLERINGHRIFYRDRGSGPAILLLHGFPTWSYDYADVALDLEKNYRVITPDFLGYGGSDKPKGHDFTVEESADIIEEPSEIFDPPSLRATTLSSHKSPALSGQAHRKTKNKKLPNISF